MDEQEAERIKAIQSMKSGLTKVMDDLNEVQMMLYEYTIKYPLTTDEGELTEDAVISTRNRNLLFWLLQNIESNRKAACDVLRNLEVESQMKCAYCTRQAADSLPGGVINLCESCFEAFREGFNKGRVYESIDRRKRGHR